MSTYIVVDILNGSPYVDRQNKEFTWEGSNFSDLVLQLRQKGLTAFAGPLIDGKQSIVRVYAEYRDSDKVVYDLVKGEFIRFEIPNRDQKTNWFIPGLIGGVVGFSLSQFTQNSDR